jgi:hypothetical protein
MNKENRTVETTKDEKLPYEKENDRSERRKDSCSPKLTKVRWWILIISLVFLVLALLYLIGQFCSLLFVPCTVGWTYVALGVLLTTVISLCLLRHEFALHEARLEDPSVVEAMIVEAETVEPRLKEPVKPDNYDKKEEALQQEVRNLKEIGDKAWTEYQVLSLSQMLVDFLQVDDLIATAQLSLTELEDYAEDSARRYDWEQCYNWQQKVGDAIGKIEQIDDVKDADYDVNRDKAAESLQAELRMLLEHIASYNMSWAEGSVIVRGIIRCVVLTLFPLLGMGLLPLVHPASENHILNVLNWSMLGVSGAITAVLLSLRKSDVVEVGNTEGKKELWHAILGVGLGLVAGVLGYSLIASNMLPAGGLIPDVESKDLVQIALSIAWAVTSGFCFERILDLARGTTVGGS